ncbi:MAG: hypothetical protein Ta2A_11140 [Treponemataceae bacterium]|nr:MAG: hypothetical protein Ta2A_11140 [Treponemataceae bacterium]
MAKFLNWIADSGIRFIDFCVVGIDKFCHFLDKLMGIVP